MERGLHKVEKKAILAEITELGLHNINEITPAIQKFMESRKNQNVFMWMVFPFYTRDAP